MRDFSIYEKLFLEKCQFVFVDYHRENTVSLPVCILLISINTIQQSKVGIKEKRNDEEGTRSDFCFLGR